MQYNNKAVNEVYVKFSSRFPIPNLLDDSDRKFTILAGHCKDDVRNNQDGTVDIIHTFKILEIEVL